MIERLKTVCIAIISHWLYKLALFILFGVSVATFQEGVTSGNSTQIVVGIATLFAVGANAWSVKRYQKRSPQNEQLRS